MRGLKWLSAFVFGAAGLILAISPASAQTDWRLELRGGPAISGGELIPGSVFVPVVTSFSFSNLESAQFDLYWEPFPNLLGPLGTSRPFVGGIVSFGGRESSLHAGLQWHIPIDRFYIESALGYGIHNGALSGVAPPLRNLGCRSLIHYSIGAGVHVTDNVTVTAQLQHMSNIVGGCNPNDGMNHFGVSVGWKF